eukprot:PITA_18985
MKLTMNFSFSIAFIVIIYLHSWRHSYASTVCHNAIYSFGDSLAEKGNWLAWNPTATGNIGRPFYGENYFERATGRFSNDQLVVDYINGSFKWSPEDEELILNNINLCVKSSSFTAIIGTGKKGSGSLLITREAQDKSTLSTRQKKDELSGKSLVGNKSLNDVKINGSPDKSPNKYKKYITVVDEVHKKNNTVNCSIFGNSSTCPKDMDKLGCPTPMNDMYFTRWPEEEEIAFMRSLGWDENAEEEPLTIEKINEFYKKHKTSLNALLEDNRWQGD